MELYKELALLYVKKHTTENTTPEELLSLFRNAEQQIINCDKEHCGKPFDIE